jgi:ferredoxin
VAVHVAAHDVPAAAVAADLQPQAEHEGLAAPENGIRIEVDRGLCIGSGDCVDTAPDVFELDSEDKAVVIDPDGAPLDDVLDAARNCPVGAVFVFGDEGQLYP